MIDTLLNALGFPRENLKLMPCEMVTTMNYAARMERIAPEEVESECGPVRPMTLVAEAQPVAQEFIGTGENILQVHPPRREENV